MGTVQFELFGGAASHDPGTAGAGQSPESMQAHDYERCRWA